MHPHPNTPSPLRRSLLLRSASVIAATAAPAWLTPALAQGPRLPPTPSQTEGPFYPVTLPADSDADLLLNGNARYTQGQPAWVEGTVTDTRGVPVAGAVVEIWQCDQAGHYHHPGDGAGPTRPSRASAKWPWARTGATASARCGPPPTAAAHRTSTSRCGWTVPTCSPPNFMWPMIRAMLAMPCGAA
jgi:hypothetical protein